MTTPLHPAPPANGPRLLGRERDLSSHFDWFGPLPSPGPSLLEELAAAGLVGRGGAGFPTATKLASVDGSRTPVVVANATEGEPLSRKDKTLLLLAPHLVLDGLELAASVVGATRRLVCIEAGNPQVRGSLNRALAERQDRATEVVETPRRFVSGQETALTNFINTGLGKPTSGRPTAKGVGGLPSVVDNAETLAHLALIARFGAAWYRSIGTVADPGSSLVTVSGAVSRPGVYEVHHGQPMSELLREVGTAAPLAVLVGGYFGQWLTPEAAARLRIDRQALAAHGLSLGCGVIAVIDGSTCGAAELARVAKWFAANSARQCGPCQFGLGDLARAMELAASGQGASPIELVQRWTSMIRGRGACHLPDGAAMFLASAVQVFGLELERHRLHGGCGARDRGLLDTPRPEAWR